LAKGDILYSGLSDPYFGLFFAIPYPKFTGMNINFKDLIPHDFNDNSHVWVYQSNRYFTIQEAIEIEILLHNFSKEWKSNGIAVRGYANLFFGHFIILIADESATGIKGFNADGSIRLIKNIERDYKVELFDRLMLAFIIHERIQLLPLAGLNLSIEKGLVTPDTLYFNNTILTKKELLNKWIIPVKDSWLSIRLLENKTSELSHDSLN
jgi:hypothetical protein